MTNKVTASKQQNGFSLLEVLLALAIFAVVTVSAYRQIGLSAQAASRVEEKQIALWVAQNVLEEYFVEREFPFTGEDVVEYPMAHREWYVVTRVTETENEKLRKLETSVYQSRSTRDDPIVTLFRLMGEK